jgi:hypothetical protein
VTAFAWYRAGRVLEAVVDETQSPHATMVMKPPVSVLLGGYSRG